MIIPGISIACFAALSASPFPLTPMFAGTLHSVICFPWLWSSASISYISDLILDGSLCCSQFPALNSASLYILPISCSLFFTSLSMLFFAVISAVWMDISSDDVRQYCFKAYFSSCTLCSISVAFLVITVIFFVI